MILSFIILKYLNQNIQNMPEAESGFIALFGDSPKMRLMECLMTFQSHSFTFDEIVDEVPMSRTTAIRELEKLLAENMIFQSEHIDKSPIYQINMSSPIVQAIQSAVSFRSRRIADSQLAAENLAI